MRTKRSNARQDAINCAPCRAHQERSRMPLILRTLRPINMRGDAHRARKCDCRHSVASARGSTHLSSCGPHASAQAHAQAYGTCAGASSACACSRRFNCTGGGHTAQKGKCVGGREGPTTMLCVRCTSHRVVCGNRSIRAQEVRAQQEHTTRTHAYKQIANNYAPADD